MTLTDLKSLGLRPAFLQDLDFDYESPDDIARILAVHRNGYDALTTAGPLRLRLMPIDDWAVEPCWPTVGDFVLIDRALERPARVLARSSLFKRSAPGEGRRLQLIAANVDTAFVVSSCNADFNPARLERYLAVVREAGAQPVILLTKSDLADDPWSYIDRAREVAGDAMIEAVNALDVATLAPLEVWLSTGETVALLGSSGVGKTTLVNALAGTGHATAAIREDDAHGRHTTRGRSMHRLASGGWVIDTPGMRELGLTDVRTGLAATFADVTDLVGRCRFSDCGHDSEPGCAIQDAIAVGDLDPERLHRYQKLLREAARHDASLGELRAKSKALGKFYKRVQAEHRGLKGDR